MHRAQAFNSLVFGEIGYGLTTRFLKLSTFHPRVLKGNPFCFAAMAFTAALQVFLTFTPGVKSFFDMPEGLDGVGWARAAGGMFVVFIVIELEKVSVSYKCVFTRCVNNLCSDNCG